MSNPEEILLELQEIQESVLKDPSTLSPADKKRFWRIIGLIKRETSPTS